MTVLAHETVSKVVAHALGEIRAPVDADMAHQVGRRKADRPVILRVRAAEAAGEGVRFCRGNEVVWLTDAVPVSFLDGPE